MGARSIIIPPSTVARPLTLWPPPQTAISSVLAREPDSGGDVGAAAALRDHRRPLVNEAVVDAPRVVPSGCGGLQQPTRECLRELAQGGDQVGHISSPLES
jgi:hypothetical protein